MERNKPTNYYARVLRVIGQDLANLFPHQLEIVERGRTFSVHVRCDRMRSESKAANRSDQAQKTGLGDFFHKLNTIHVGKAPEKPAIVSVNRSYTSIDISRIDTAGMDRRNELNKIPDIHDLGEALRTIGRILDAEGGRLVKIFRDQRRVSFEYIGTDGATKNVDMTRAELIKTQRDYYHGRDDSGHEEPWKGKA